MTSDPKGWFLTSQALDHHDTVAALDGAVAWELGETLADDLATGLARAGYALVRIQSEAPADLAHDLTEVVAASLDTAPGFLARTED